MRPSAHTREVRLPECVLFSGPLESVLHLTPGLATREPRMLLVHTPAGTATAVDETARNGTRSLLLVGSEAEAGTSGQTPVLALAVPRARATPALLADATQLKQTPLVRASRVVIANLLANLPVGIAGESARVVDEVLLSIVRGILHENPHTAAPESRDATLAVRLSALIEARHSDPSLDVAQIARELHTSRRQLYRYVDGGGVAALLTERRIATARDLLVAYPDLTVAEIAERSGFASASRLRARFTERWGTTPTAYRRLHLQSEFTASPLD